MGAQHATLKDYIEAIEYHNMVCRKMSVMCKKCDRAHLVQKLSQMEHPVQDHHKTPPATQKQTHA